MTDMTETIMAKSDQLNACDLIGGAITVKITGVSKVTGDQPISINYEGDNGKPFKPCKSIRRVLVKVWGNDGKNYVGKSMTLYCDDKVKFAGQEVGGIRISHMSDIDKPVTMVLTASRTSKKPYTVQPLAKARSKKEIIAEGVKAEDVKKWGANLSSADKAVATANWGEIKKQRGE